MSSQQLNKQSAIELSAQRWLHKKAAEEGSGITSTIVTAGDKALSPVAKLFNTSKSTVAGTATGTASALGYYLLSGLWDKKGKNRLTRGLTGLGLGLGIGVGTKFGLEKFRPEIKKILDGASGDGNNTEAPKKDNTTAETDKKPKEEPKEESQKK